MLERRASCPYDGGSKWCVRVGVVEEQRSRCTFELKLLSASIPYNLSFPPSCRQERNRHLRNPSSKTASNTGVRNPRALTVYWASQSPDTHTDSAGIAALTLNWRLQEDLVQEYAIPSRCEPEAHPNNSLVDTAARRRVRISSIPSLPTSPTLHCPFRNPSAQSSLTYA